jgi:hypothetical protein
LEAANEGGGCQRAGLEAVREDEGRMQGVNSEGGDGAAGQGRLQAKQWVANRVGMTMVTPFHLPQTSNINRQSQSTPLTIANHSEPQPPTSNHRQILSTTANTGNNRQPPATTGNHRQPPATTGNHRQQPASTGNHRQLPATTGNHRQQPATTGNNRQHRQPPPINNCHLPMPTTA